MANRAIPHRVAFHVMPDEELGSIGNRAFECLQPGRHVIVRIDRLPHVVQQRRQYKLLVPRHAIAGQLKYLKAVVERIALGVIRGILLHILQRREQHAVGLEAIDILERIHFAIQIQIRILLAEESSSAMLARSIALPVMELLKA